MSLIALLVIVLVACIVLWATQRLLAAFGVGDPIATVIYVIVVLLLLALLLQTLGVIQFGRLRL